MTTYSMDTSHHIILGNYTILRNIILFLDEQGVNKFSLTSKFIFCTLVQLDKITLTYTSIAKFELYKCVKSMHTFEINIEHLIVSKNITRLYIDEQYDAKRKPVNDMGNKFDPGNNLQKFVNLKEISFCSNFSGFNEQSSTSSSSILETLSTLTQLEKISFGKRFPSVHGTGFNGSINEMEKMINLKTIVFGYRFNRPIGGVIEKMTNLEEIYISGDFNQSLTPIFTLNKLKKLTIIGDFDKSLCGIEKMINLEYLQLCFCQSSNILIDGLSKLINLEVLNIYNYNGSVNELISLTKLKKLILCGDFNKPIDGFDQLINLEYLWLDNAFNQPIDKAFKPLSNRLKYFHIGSGFRESINIVYTLTNLKQIDAECFLDLNLEKLAKNNGLEIHMRGKFKLINNRYSISHSLNSLTVFYFFSNATVGILCRRNNCWDEVNVLFL